MVRFLRWWQGAGISSGSGNVGSWGIDREGRNCEAASSNVAQAFPSELPLGTLLNFRGFWALRVAKGDEIDGFLMLEGGVRRTRLQNQARASPSVPRCGSIRMVSRYSRSREADRRR